MDSQIVPDDEPTILISATTEDALDDEVMPFESRSAKGKSDVQKVQSQVRGTKSEAQKAQSGVRNPKSDGKSGVRSSGSDLQEAGPADQPASKQPKLFNGNDH
jgi:hypothetical protein